MNKHDVVQQGLEKLRTKEFSFNFFSMDTKGQAIASVANIYEHAKTLQNLGYKVNILHEKNDYTPVTSWLGEEYSSLPHISAETGRFQVGVQDFLIIPELFTNVMEQTKNMPCKRVVLSQVYDYVFDYLPPGVTWSQYAINTVITTTEKQKIFLQSYFHNLDIRVIPVSIPEYFVEGTLPKKPIVAVSARQSRDALKLVKMFYLKYPQFKWINFKAMGGMSRTDFAKQLQETAIAVWIDDISAFGTFPLEAMKTKNLVIGKIPNIPPEWMEKDNGFWTQNTLEIADLLASVMKMWLEDDPQLDEIYESMKKLKDKYSVQEERDAIQSVYGSLLKDRTTELEIISSRLKQQEKTTI